MMKNVLLVDDNPGILDAVRDCLQSRLPGVSMHASVTGIGALDIVRSWPIDMLITEVDLPDMNGYELIDQVRRQRPGMPVMVTTDDCSRKVVELLTSLGVNRWIEKPFDGKTIAATVRNELDPLHNCQQRSVERYRTGAREIVRGEHHEDNHAS